MKNKVKGTVSVSKKVIIQIVSHIIKECEEISSIAIPKKKFSSVILKRNEGIYIARTKNGIFVEVYIILKFGADLKMVQNTVTDKIKKEVSQMGIKTDKVIVCIEGTVKK